MVIYGDSTITECAFKDGERALFDFLHERRTWTGEKGFVNRSNHGKKLKAVRKQDKGKSCHKLSF